MCFASELNVFGEDLNSIISCDTGGHRWTGTIPVMALAKTLIRAQVKSSRCHLSPAHQDLTADRASISHASIF